MTRNMYIDYIVTHDFRSCINVWVIHPINLTQITLMENSKDLFTDGYINDRKAIKLIYFIGRLIYYLIPKKMHHQKFLINKQKISYFPSAVDIAFFHMRICPGSISLYKYSKLYVKNVLQLVQRVLISTLITKSASIQAIKKNFVRPVSPYHHDYLIIATVSIGQQVFSPLRLKNWLFLF